MSGTIAAISTPNAAGGIGIIKISGEAAISIADSIFTAADNTKLSSLPGYSVKFGKITDGNRELDQAIAVVYRAPKSYTGEDVVELQCHGGLFLMQQILRLALQNGASPAGPGEFTKRAFLNGKLDLTEAESVMSLISAHGEQAANAALSALEGSLSKEIRQVSEVLISAAAHMSAWVDYPDEEIEELDYTFMLNNFQNAREKLAALTEKFDAGQAITEGVATAIVGRPNVGKSTLMNLLLQKNRSIVTDIAGTTRDVIEETARIGNVVLRLSDTAGIHSSEDFVEKLGIEMAEERLKTAAFILAVFDGHEPLNAEDTRILEACKGRKSVAIINKSDLGNVLSETDVSEYVSRTLVISAKNSDCYTAIRDVIEDILGTAEFDTGAAMLQNERQLDCCMRAITCIDEAIYAINSGLTMDAINVSVDAAIDPLLELTGERVSDAVVNEVFAQFCVGK